MKILNLLLMGLLLASTASAQALSSSADAPDVTVIRINWHKDIYVPALYDDPMSANQEHDDLKREQKAIRKENAIRIQQGQSPLALPTKEIASSTREIPPGPSVNYVYEAKIKNTGVKTIRAIVWEHSLFDPATRVEVGHHRFTSNVRIRAGKDANLIGLSTTPASSVVQATKSSKEIPDKYAERVVINRIEYDDGSFWQRSPN